MAVTLWILRHNGEPIFKFGPSRYTVDSEDKALIDYVCNEIHKHPGCKVSLNHTWYEGKPSISGKVAMDYNGPQDNRKLRYMMKRQCRWFWTHVYNIFVDSPKGRRIIDFELEYIDL